jgi:hypothetical protein
MYETAEDMEQALRLGTTIVGTDFKALIGRHCMRELVFYSIELLDDKQPAGYYFMTYDRQLGKYQFVPAPESVPAEFSARADEFSAYIMEHFHKHFLN